MIDGIQIFMDGADENDITKLLKLDYVAGITTNPTLMRQSGVDDYSSFGRRIAHLAGKTHVSFEVLSTDPKTVLEEAQQISEWGKNVWVKIPVVSGSGESLMPTMALAQKHNIKINVTAVFSENQINELAEVLDTSAPAIVSIFAGRIADTGVNPATIFSVAKRMFSKHKEVRLLWASTRQLYSIVEAQDCGADIITVSPQLLSKVSLLGKNLEEYSVETVQMFENDAEASGLSL